MMFFASLKMMLLVSLAMMRCLPLCARRHTSLGVAVIIGIANIICRRQISLKKAIRFREWLFSGWGIGIRTPTYRVRVCCATVTQFPNMFCRSLDGFYIIHAFCGFVNYFLQYFSKIFSECQNPCIHAVFRHFSILESLSF